MRRAGGTYLGNLVEIGRDDRVYCKADAALSDVADFCVCVVTMGTAGINGGVLLGCGLSQGVVEVVKRTLALEPGIGEFFVIVVIPPTGGMKTGVLPGIGLLDHGRDRVVAVVKIGAGKEGTMGMATGFRGVFKGVH